MALGGRFHHRAHEVEIIPVLEPVLLVVSDDPHATEYALPGDYLIIYPDAVEKISCDDFLKNYVCDEAPRVGFAEAEGPSSELSLTVIGQRDLV